MTMRRVLALVLVWAAAGSALSAYLQLGVPIAGRAVIVRWPRLPIRYFIADRDAPQVTANQLRAAIERAALSWQNVATSSVSFELVGFTGAAPSDEDGVSTLGFEDRPDLDETLGATSFLIDSTTGEILESDIFFNAAFPWSVASAGEAGRFDLESIALHELGHMIGLGHSAIGETELRPGGGRRVIAVGSIMFPIAFQPGAIAERVLHDDDVAGASDLYPDGDFEDVTGSIGGTVTLNGRGVLGAHVIAFHLESGKLVGGFSVNREGQFTIAGLQPGPHLLRVEPLDDVSEGDIFDEETPIDTDFVVSAHDRVVVVPRGGSTSVEIGLSSR